MKGIILGAIALFAVFAIIGNTGSDSNSDGGASGAKDVCKQEVSYNLVAPDTAKFDSMNVVDLGDGKFNVDGLVSSQNGFGAMVQGNYACTAKHISGDNWHTTVSVG